MPGSTNCTGSGPKKRAGSRPGGSERSGLRVPQGVGHRNLLLLNVAADGTCEMSEEDAESFVRAGWQRVDAGD
jgi:hypothetical protein